jgi:ATP-dependent Lon protease
MARLDDRLKAIQSNISMATAEEKTRVTKYLSGILAALQPVKEQPVNSVAVMQSLPANELHPASYEIIDGTKGYGYEKIFGPYMVGAESIIIEDPYIRYRHQVDNLNRFCALAVSMGSAKSILLKSGKAFGEDSDDADSRLETLKRDLAKNHNIKFDWTRSEKLHDREVVFSNGWIVKIGRGLDIYHKPENWSSVGAVDFNLRSCRQTKVDILRRDGN